MAIAALGTESTSLASRNMVDKNTLDKEDFLKLLITELRYQDALEPMNDREFMAQLAQMSALEQMQNLNATVETGLETAIEAQHNLQNGLWAVLETITGFNSFNQSLNLLGKEVTYRDADEMKEGTVTALKQKEGYFVALVDDLEVPLSQITVIK